MIRKATPSDAGPMCDIYNEYILDTWITFEENVLAANEMETRIGQITQHYPWMVHEENNKVTGYIYAEKWKGRSAYRYSAEIGIYLDSDYTGKGIGTKLLENLLQKLKEQSIHSAIYGVSLPNPASVALCEKFGFKKVAHFKEVGFKFGQWLDVGYWELLL